MMGKVRSARSAGSIIRRVREDQQMSRAALSEMTGVSPRALYALEQGESENFGLGKYLKLLDALGLHMSVDAGCPNRIANKPASTIQLPELELSDAWKLDDEDTE